MILIAIAGSYFVHRLCFELGRILWDGTRPAKEEKKDGEKEAAVIN